jgi:SAM-dependent methyltransferase
MILCPHCRQQVATQWTRDIQFRNLRCTACGEAPAEIDGVTVFAPELASPELDLADEGFSSDFFGDLASAEEKNFWFRGRNKLILWAIKKYCQKFERFIEVGCGTGFVLHAISRSFPKRLMLGTELFTAGLKHAGRRVPEVQLIQMDARNIPFTKEFDLVGAFDVIEHIIDDRKVLSEISRAVKPGGHLVLTVPQHPWLWSKSDTYAKHQRRYSKSELHEKIESAGFEVVRSTSFVSILMPALILSRYLDRLRPNTSYDPMREVTLPSLANWLFERALDAELIAIRTGINFPIGGTRLVVGRLRFK